MDFQINNSNEEFKTRFPTAIAALPSHNVIFIGFDNGDIQTYVTQDLNSSGSSGKSLYVIRDVMSFLEFFSLNVLVMKNLGNDNNHKVIL